MNTNQNAGSIPHHITSDVTSEKNFEKVDFTVNRLFEIDEDIPADPVDELLEVTLLSEEHLPSETDPNSRITEDIIRKDRLDRARYGVSRRDLWDFGFNLAAIMATGFRRLRDNTDDPAKKEAFNKLIAGCIAMNERGAMNDLSYFKAPEQNVAETKRWDEKWGKEIENFQDALNSHWMDISSSPAPFTWNRGTVSAIISRLDGKFTYDEKKDYLSDPITPGVPVDVRNEHLRQRAHNGYSEWDLKHFRTYLVWIIAQACIFFASTDAHGFPVSKKLDTFEAYSEFLMGFARDLMLGEANTCTDRTMMFNLIEVDREAYARAVAQFTQVIPRLWD